MVCCVYDSGLCVGTRSDGGGMACERPCYDGLVWEWVRSWKGRMGGMIL
jgi:hypothetical protein